MIASNVSVSASVFTGNASGPIAGGGGIFFHSTFDDGETYTLTVSNSKFSTNRAAIVGGGAINISGFSPNAATNATISNCSFSNNTAGNGGAIYTDGIPTVITNSKFNGNQAGFNGGAIFGSNFGDAALASGFINLSDLPLLNISNSTFDNNSIVGIPPNSPPPTFVFNLFASALSGIFGQGQGSVTLMSAGGGAIAAEFGSNIRISKSSLINNSAPDASGGALLIGGTAGTPGAIGQNYLKISNSSCSGNTASIGNNSAVINAANLDNNPNGVQFDNTDGSCKN